MSTNADEHEPGSSSTHSPLASAPLSPDDAAAKDGGEVHDTANPTPPPPPPPTQWQAIWAPQYNAYYFYNALTQETTWSNPLQPEEAPPSSSPVDQPPTTEEADDPSSAAGSSSYPNTSSASQYAALQAAALAQGIDPDLAHLDPSLLSSVQGSSNLPGDVPTFTAQFNAHTGRFTASSARTPGHLSEYERMKRMSEFYFDVNRWEEDLAKQQEGEGSSGKKKKRPTKKDLERFKEQKRLKKIAKTAWLRT